MKIHSEFHPNIQQQSMKNRPNIDPKSIKNQPTYRPKIDPKSIQNRSKIDKDPILDPFGSQVTVLGASWGVLGASWLEKGGQHGSNLAPKTEPKSRKNRSQMRPKFGCLLGSDFWRILVDLGRQNGAKLASESHPKSIPTSKGGFLKKLCFSLRKTNDFEGSGVQSWEWKSIKNRSKNEVMMARHLGIDFSWILIDSGGQVGAKLGSKIDQKSINKFNVFQTRFWLFFGSFGW